MIQSRINESQISPVHLGDQETVKHIVAALGRTEAARSRTRIVLDLVDVMSEITRRHLMESE